jgi:hypothetical protein
MPIKQITNVDVGIERRLLIAMIMNKDFLARMIGHFKPEWLSPYATIVSTWVLDYYNTYKDAPKRAMNELFKQNSGHINEGDKDAIKVLLESLSDEFAEGFNQDYLHDKAIEYFHRAGLHHTASQVIKALDANKLKDAQKIYEDYRVRGTISQEWYAPLEDKQFMMDVYSKSEEPLFHLDPRLRDLIGDFESGWLVGIVGSAKRGKTWMLQEIAYQAMLCRKRVVFVSLEMDSWRLTRRFYKTLTGNVDDLYNEDEKGRYVKIPVFDCSKNQSNLCKLTGRTCSVGVEDRTNYKICQFCRGKKKYDEQGKLQWQPMVHMDEKYKHRLTLSSIRKQAQQFTKYHGNRLFRLTHFPAFSATLRDIEGAIDTLEFRDNFIPDVIVVDYSDIIRGDSGLDDTAMANRIWMALKGMASRRSCLVVTATQGNRASFQHDTIQQTDMSWDIRKLAHADAVMGLSQSKEEKEMKYIRVNVLVHRWREFMEQKQLMILQANDIGQTFLDSEIIIRREE